MPTFEDPGTKPFEYIVGKGENASNHYIPLFPQCFLPYQRKIASFTATMKLSSANAFNFDVSKHFY